MYYCVEGYAAVAYLSICLEVQVGKSPLLTMFSLENPSNVLLEMSPTPSLKLKSTV